MTWTSSAESVSASHSAFFNAAFAQSEKSVITTILRNGFGPICGCVKSNSEQRASFARGRATSPRKLRLATSLPSSAPAITKETENYVSVFSGKYSKLLHLNRRLLYLIRGLISP